MYREFLDGWGADMLPVIDNLVIIKIMQLSFGNDQLVIGAKTGPH